MSNADEKWIKSKLERLRMQISQGDDSEIAIWIIPDELACSQRPLRDHPKFGGRQPLPPEAKQLVIHWVNRVKALGIQSIICMLEPAQLDRYYIRGGIDLHPRGLLGYYKSQGFNVRHIAATDYQRPPLEKMQAVLIAFEELPKPVLLHCSASIDRTTPVAAFVTAQRREKAKLLNNSRNSA